MILNTNMILDAIKKLAATGIPERAIPPVEGLQRIYLNLRPKNFKRPSLLIQSVATQHEPVSHKLIRTRESLLLTVFCEVDEYSHSGTGELLELRQQVLNLFRPGTLPVEDRFLHVKASTGGRNWDAAYVDVTVEYYDVVTEQGPTEPLMERVDTTIRTKE